MRTLPIVTALLAAICGCEAEPPPRAPSAPATDAAQAAEITRDVAINMARHDAAVRFPEPGMALIDAQRVGRFWVVELRGPSGHGLRYAISRNDGSIKQRTMLQ